MKILVADKISSSGVDYLKEQAGFEVIEAYGSSPEKIKELVADDVTAVIVRSETKITREVLEVGKSLRAVGRAGVGVDNIDVEAATESGVIVMNTPSGNTIATAELTFTHMLCGARPVAQANRSMQEGQWNRKAFSGFELNGKTLGVLGMGRIGSEVANRAKAFNMTVVAYDPFLTASRAENLGVQQVELEEVYARADYITVHMPMTDATRAMINKDAFAKMKDGVRIFNCARGGIIHEDDLVVALKEGKVASAGLDVYTEEPLAEDSSLRGIENLVLTPHLGASTKEAQESVGLEVAEAIVCVLKDGPARNALNMPSIDPKAMELLQPYLTLGEALGTLVQQIAPKQVNKLNITYWGKVIEIDALPLTRSIQRGYLREISGDDVNDVNAPMLISRLGVEVEVTKSNTEVDFTDLIKVEVSSEDGSSISVSGTLLGKRQAPRLVAIDEHRLEIEPSGALLILRNNDVPGMVGKVGTVLGDAGVNIGNLSLGRTGQGDMAFSVFELDSAPDDGAREAIASLENVCEVIVVKV